MMTTKRNRNTDKDPFKNLELYLVPLVVALAAWVLRFVADVACPASVLGGACAATSSFLAWVYVIIFTGLACLAASQGRGAYARAKRVLAVFQVGAGALGGGGGKEKED